MNKKIAVLTFAIFASSIEIMQASCGGCDGRGYGDHDRSSDTPPPLTKEQLEVWQADRIALYKEGTMSRSHYRDYRGMSCIAIQGLDDKRAKEIDDERNKPENGGPIRVTDISTAVQKAIQASYIPVSIIPAPITVARTEEEKYREALKLIERSKELQDYAAALAQARKA